MQNKISKSEIGVMFKLGDGVQYVVQIVGFVGGVRMCVDYFMYIWEVSVYFVNIMLSIGVVGVGVNKDMIVFVVECGCCQFGYIVDDVCFILCWNYNC